MRRMQNEMETLFIVQCARREMERQLEHAMSEHERRRESRRMAEEELERESEWLPLTADVTRSAVCVSVDAKETDIDALLESRLGKMRPVRTQDTLQKTQTVAFGVNT